MKKKNETPYPKKNDLKYFQIFPHFLQQRAPQQLRCRNTGVAPARTQNWTMLAVCKVLTLGVELT
jgi:hypothetical protein